MIHQHKIAILKYTTKNFWLLLIPLARGLIAVGFDLYSWVRGAYWDIIVIALMFGIAFLRWYCFRFEIGEKEIFVRDGVLIRNEFSIPYSAVSSAAAVRRIWLRPVKAVSVSIDSDSVSVLNKPKNADIEMIVNLNDYSKIYNNIPIKSTSAKITYKASKADLVFFSLTFSSAISGMIFLGTFLIQGSRIVGDQLERQFLNAVNGVTEFMTRIITGVTPAAVALTLMIVFCWGLSFTLNLLRHINFRVQRCGGSIIVRSGFFSKRKHYVNSGKVNCADLRQNMLMKICRVMSLHVSCTGYGKGRNELPVFVPVTKRQRVMSSMRLLLPNFELSGISLKPKKTCIMPYIWAPLFSAILLPVPAFFALRFFPDWEGIIKFLLVMGEIPSLYLLAVKLAAKFTSGIGTGGDSLTLKYCRFSTFHTVIVPKSRIACIRLSRTIFQRINGTCDVWVYSRGERAARHRVRGILYNEAAQTFGTDTSAQKG